MPGEFVLIVTRMRLFQRETKPNQNRILQLKQKEVRHIVQTPKRIMFNTTVGDL